MNYYEPLAISKSSDSKRIYLNPAIGCSSKCSYCYLPSLGIKIGSKPMKFFSHSFIIDELTEKNIFIPGKSGSIISIGCYCDPWSFENKNVTKELIKYYIQLGNPIQMSTKYFIDYTDFIDITNKIHWEGQLSLYISNSTIKYWRKFENATVSPHKRFKSFKINKVLKIPTLLYIKPIIDSVTILDIKSYLSIIELYKLTVILGDIFSNQISFQKATLGSPILFLNKSNDYTKIENVLKSVCKVYRYSIDFVNENR